MSVAHRIGRAFGTAAFAATLVAAASATGQAQTSDTSQPKVQLPADQRAFQAARATVDPEQRVAAFQKFLKDYPKSSRRDRAHSDLFDTLLKNFPDRTAEIDEQAQLIVKGAGKDFSRLYYESEVASDLAEAGTHGVDLPRAEKFANDVTNKFTEAAYDKGTTEAYKKYKLPPPNAASLHARFASKRAEALAALAKVDMDENKLQQALTALDEAYRLDPTGDKVNLIRGEMALDNHNDAEALEDFERAQLAGELKSPWREKMMELYRQAHAGSDAGFVAEMDTRYAQLFPAPFTPAAHTLANGSHTALLELFTGSACAPCVGADLAVDAALQTYPRKDLVALAFDQHIPNPDPLANADSVARAAIYDLAGTPTYVLDGKKLSLSGGSRLESEGFYNTLSKLVDAEAEKPTGVQLKLTAELDSTGLVHANASVTIDNPDQLQKSLAPDPPATPAAAGKAAPVTPPPTTAPLTPVEPHLVVNFALVEDDIRYSGENGVRFHRMVVRSLAHPAASGSPVEAGKTFEATFNPTEISSQLTDYLNTYEGKNERFGKVEFLSKNTAMQPGHLAVAAWVQDTATHRVLQAAFVPLGKGE
jgi:tetratricopeptide (TPR) repeat protein